MTVTMTPEYGSTRSSGARPHSGVALRSSLNSEGRRTRMIDFLAQVQILVKLDRRLSWPVVPRSTAIPCRGSLCRRVEVPSQSMSRHSIGETSPTGAVHWGRLTSRGGVPDAKLGSRPEGKLVCRKPMLPLEPFMIASSNGALKSS